MAVDRNCCTSAELRLSVALGDKATIHTAYQNAVKTRPADFDGSPECLRVNVCVCACVHVFGEEEITLIQISRHAPGSCEVLNPSAN